MHSILVLNGPNLNLLGSREPGIYGANSLDEIRELCVERASKLGVGIEFRQTNHEGELLELIHGARGRYDGIVLNAAALTHTSVALLDALLAVEIPTIEVHLSNIHKREDYRAKSFVSPAASGVVFGFGATGYLLALEGLASILDAAGG